MRNYILATLAFCIFICTVWIIWPFLPAIAWAVVISITTWPIFKYLKSKVIRSSFWSSILMLGLLLLLFMLLVVPLPIQLSKEINQLSNLSEERFNQYISESIQVASRIPILGDHINSLVSSLELDTEKISEFLLDYRKQGLIVMASLTKALLDFIAYFLLTFLLLFFIYKDGDKLLLQIRAVAAKFNALSYIDECSKTVKAAVVGYIFTAFVQGFLAAIGYAVAGVEIPFFLGLITGLASLIPFGTPLIYMPIIINLYLSSGTSTTTLILLSLWCVFVVSLADNLIRPLFISQTTELSFVLVLIGILGGILSFGLIGIVIGPLVLAMMQSIWLELSNNSSNSNAV
jgi:predicted PurR-regulated permease PerM